MAYFKRVAALLVVTVCGCGGDVPPVVQPPPAASLAIASSMGASPSPATPTPPQLSFEGVQPLGAVATISGLASVVQPARLEPVSVCAGAKITLYPREGAEFSVSPGDTKVMFSPCGVSATVEPGSWSKDKIVVTVPPEAESGPVWLAAPSNGRAHTVQMETARACLNGLNGLDGLGGHVECDATMGGMGNTGLLRHLQGHGLNASRPPSAGILQPVAGGRPILPIGANRPPAGLFALPMPQITPITRGAAFELGKQGLCRVMQPGRAGGMELTVPSNETRMRVGSSAARGAACFQSCNQLSFLDALGKPANHLEVLHPPRLNRFVPLDAISLGKGNYRVERGSVTIEWAFSSDAANLQPTVSVGASVVSHDVKGSAARDILTSVDATAIAQNACGAMPTQKISLQARSRLTLEPYQLVLAPGESAPVTVRVDHAFTTPTKVEVWISGGSSLSVSPGTVTIPANASSALVSITRNATFNATGTHLGEIHASPATPADEARITDAATSLSVIAAKSPLISPGQHANEVRLRGLLQYRECLPADFLNNRDYFDPPVVPLPNVDGSRCLLDAANQPIFHPIRRARVEIWSKDGPFWGIAAVTASLDDGRYDITLPTSSGAEYNVVVVASGPAGQVNFRDNDATWFWKDLQQHHTAVGGDTFDISWGAERDDAKHFNALDALLTAWDYALLRTGTSLADADRKFHRISIIPGSTSSGVTLPDGLASHIWVGADEQVFNDKTIIHEYGHHLQRMSGSYQMWPAAHNGCYATIDVGICAGHASSVVARADRCTAADSDGDGACWLNSGEFAWFEGFPTLLAMLVGNWDSNVHLSFASRAPLFQPATCGCPLVTSTHKDRNNSVIQPSSIENYMTNALFDLTRRLDVTKNGAAVSPADLEAAVIDITLNRLRDRMPTVTGFRAEWDTTFPGNAAIGSVYSTYGF